MALKLNLAQINSAAKGNNPLRETLTGVYNEFQNLYRQTGTGPIQKIDTAAVSFTQPPPASRLSVTGANGSFLVSITLPQAASGASAPTNATNAPIYQELSSSPAANFSTDVTTYPASSGASFVFPNPGQTLYWRLRSSWDQKNWNSYTVQPGAVSSGVLSSGAAGSNLSLNQSNYATVDSTAGGAAATVRIYGSGGVGSSWTSVLGAQSKVIPGGTLTNVAYGSNLYVVWDGAKYQAKTQLAQTFPDNWIPVGKVSVVANGSPFALPTIKPVVTAGSVVALQILSPGNGMTSAPTLTIDDSSGSGATATAVISAGQLTQAVITSSGSGYSASPTCTASGGTAGSGGGGGPQGSNGGRLYADV